MSQKFLINGFKWIEDSSQFNEDNFFEVHIQYPKFSDELYGDLLFLLETIKVDKVKKLLVNLCYKKEYIIHKRNLKETLNHLLGLRKFTKSWNLTKRLG